MEEKVSGQDIIDACNFLKKKDLDSKRLKRIYLSRFEQYGYKCAFAKTNLLKKYKELSKSISKLYQLTLDSPECVRSGNHVVVTVFLDHTLNTIHRLKDRLSNVNNVDLLVEGHNIIIEKMEELIKVLNSNLQSPITLKEVEDTLKS